MSDHDDTTIGYVVTLKVRVPLGTREWRFTTTADGQGVAVTKPVMVAVEETQTTKGPVTGPEER